MTGIVLAVLLGITLAGVVYVWRRMTREPVIGVVVADPVKERAAAEAELEVVKIEADAFRLKLEDVLKIPDDQERLRQLAALGKKGGRR